MDRENPVAAKTFVFGRVSADAAIFHVAAEACDVLREGRALAAGRVNAVGIVVNRRIADQRRCPGPDFVAQILPGLEWVALRGQRTGSVRVGVEGALVERNLVLRQEIAGPDAPIFGERETRPQSAAGADLRIGGVALVADEIEAAVVAPEQLPTEQDRLVEKIGIGETEFDR